MTIKSHFMFGKKLLPIILTTWWYLCSMKQIRKISSIDGETVKLHKSLLIKLNSIPVTVNYNPRVKSDLQL